MNVRITYNDLGTIKGYTTLTSSRKQLMERLSRLGVSIEQIQTLDIDEKAYDPQKLKG